MKIYAAAVAAVAIAASWLLPDAPSRLAPPAEAAVPHVCVASADLFGRVVGVSDGDTLTLLTGERRQIRVRLVEIDAPESGQPWGGRAKEALSVLVYGRDVRIADRGLDRYGRTLGRVYASGKDVNTEMVRQGAAWAYRQYLTDRSLIGEERQAREAHRGLWSLDPVQQEPPWNWRRDRRTGMSRDVSLEPASPQSRCGAKHYCGQMTSCAEARFYLKTCRAALDGDGDGVPCETLCRG